MTTDSNSDRSHSSSQLNQDLPFKKDKLTNESTGGMDMMKHDTPSEPIRERFELLSAYLDGELTAAERRQVEEWLSNDASVKRLYARLLKVRQGLRNLPVPQSQPAEEAVKQVLVRARRRSRFLVLGGGAAIAACVLGAISGIFPGGESGAPEFAQKPIEQTQPIKPVDASPSPLMVAINNPIIPIPKTDQASPKNSGDRSQLDRKIENEVN
ncbi:MAG: zf-HC2 domain-containing protein [Cyanomargarita calcarea GSE-NOS-MK-12-04C]|jgi:negative regulator of sigma E activity|uniref:Zf-HC2 domain-containing protein n=1 Tax=Cyanomargarita calcarea GSE-NOS-MK-12-04C TaxID=2839659 RepID=A0A951UTU9_9CYAN|nr:zf-HC2 domain-containing protein [Cyanomargarita calcarea GSE-NOS-MK-12-04C]